MMSLGGRPHNQRLHRLGRKLFFPVRGSSATYMVDMLCSLDEGKTWNKIASCIGDGKSSVQSLSSVDDGSFIYVAYAVHETLFGATFDGQGNLISQITFDSNSHIARSPAVPLHVSVAKNGDETCIAVGGSVVRHGTIYLYHLSNEGSRVIPLDTGSQYGFPHVVSAGKDFAIIFEDVMRHDVYYCYLRDGEISTPHVFNEVSVTGILGQPCAVNGNTIRVGWIGLHSTLYLSEILHGLVETQIVSLNVKDYLQAAVLPHHILYMKNDELRLQGEPLIQSIPCRASRITGLEYVSRQGHSMVGYIADATFNAFRLSMGKPKLVI